MLHGSDRPTRSNSILAGLSARESDGRPIHVGVIGAGSYGRTLISQLIRCRGMRVSVVCDLDTEAASAALTDSGIEVDAPPACDRSAIRRRIASGRPAVVEDLSLLEDAGLDVLVDCTGRPETGAMCTRVAAAGGCSLVMVNVEADSVIGCEAAALIEAAGGVYTLADGDQPSLMLGLADWAAAIGFEVVAAGKWTDAYARADGEKQLARWRSEGRTVLESDITYFDGTKAQMELASAANCLGFGIEASGTIGPALTLQEIPERFRAAGGASIFTEEGVVDYVNCTGVAERECHPGGVFVVARSDNRLGMAAMARKHCIVSDDRTHVLFYRPYHLIGVETVWSIARAVVDGVPTAAPKQSRSVEVVAVSKSDLRAGAALAGLGGELRGVMVRSEEAERLGLLPLSLAAGCTLNRNIVRDERVLLRDVAPHESSECWRLRFGSFDAAGNRP